MEAQITFAPVGNLDRESGWTRTSMLAVAVCFVLNILDGMDILLMSYIVPVLANDG